VTPEVEMRIEELARRIQKARTLFSQARAQKPYEAREELIPLVLEHNQGTPQQPQVVTRHLVVTLTPIQMGEVSLFELIMAITQSVQNPEVCEQILEKLFPNKFAYSTLEGIAKDFGIQLPEIKKVTNWRVKIQER